MYSSEVTFVAKEIKNRCSNCSRSLHRSLPAFVPFFLNIVYNMIEYYTIHIVYNLLHVMLDDN